MVLLILQVPQVIYTIFISKKKTRIKISDITGRIFISEKTNTEKHTIKLDAAQGIYFYTITDKQNRVQQGKLIIN
jgi:hypothetical protein